MHYFSNKNFQKSTKIFKNRPLTFKIGELKFRDLAKWFLKLIMTKSNFQNIVMMSFQWC